MCVLRAWRVGLGAGVLLAAGWTLADNPALAGDPAGDYPQCSRTPTASDLEGAKGAHKAATQFYERADYARAIQYWRDAYEFDCTAHGVLINIANAYEKKGEREMALQTLDAYLTRAPDAPDATNVQEKIQNLQNALKGLPPPRPTASASASAPPPPPPSASAPPQPAEGPRPYDSTPWLVVGAGGVALVAGAILTPVGLSTISSAESDCPTRVGCEQDVADRGNRGRTQTAIGLVALGLGTAGVAGGLLWQFVLNKPAPPGEAPVVVTPAAGPGFSGLSVIGRF